MQLVAINFGEQISVALKRHKTATGEKPTQVRERVADFLGCGLSTIRNLADAKDVPVGLDGRYRACALLIAINEPLDAFGLSEDDLPRTQTVETLQRALAAHCGTWGTARDVRSRRVRAA